MVNIRPFKGYRYNKDKVDVSKAIFPPYEIRKTDYKRIFSSKNNYNVLKLILGDITCKSGIEKRYEYSEKLFNEWIKKGYISKDDNNCIYVYSQEFEHEGEKIDRTGFISLVEIEEFGKNVFPHELTLHDTMINRQVLLEKTRSNMGLVFSLYNDDNKKIDNILDDFKSKSPVLDIYTDYEGVRHRIWIIDDPDKINEIKEEMKKRKILIADGHHRYNTALKYSKNRPDDKKSKYISMMFVNMKKDGLVILPTHRLVKRIDNFNVNDFLKKISEDFYIEKILFDSSNIRQKTYEMKKNMKTKGSHSFGLYVGGNTLYILTLKDEKTMFERHNHHSKTWLKFDINVLHSMIINDILGIDINNPDDQSKFDYVKDIHNCAYECVEKVSRGDFQIAFFVNPANIETIQKISEMGEIVPQKSTCFYPKVYSGIVMYKFENHTDNF